MSYQNQLSFQIFALVSSTTLAFGILNSTALSQTAADGSLNTQVNTSDNLNFLVTGGVQANNNLFHSFERFSIPSDGAIQFANSLEIQNIINRVTGGSPSLIDGLMKANGSANVFLINPNGIIFGENASLNIGGSFLASTASSLLFGDGSEFSTDLNQTKPLLTVSVPIGLQFGNNPGQIVHQSTNLQVQPDRNIAFVGGEINLDGGQITAPSGQIELGSVAGNSFVNLSSNLEGWNLNYEQVKQFQDLELSNLARVDASGNGGGNIHVQGRNVTLTEGSKLISNTLGAIPGEKIVVNASESLQVIGDTDLPNLFEPLEQAFGIFVPIRSSISTTTLGSSEAGDIEINTNRLLIKDGGQITANSLLTGSGNGGNLLIDASESVEIAGTAVLSEIQGSSPFSAPDFPDRFFVEINGASSLGTVSGGFGQSGNITINTTKFIARDGGLVTTNPFAEGDGGDLVINASSIELNGTSPSELVPSGLLAPALSNGDAGNLTITTDRLKIFNGARISAATFSNGQGGNITVNASDSIELAGTSVTGLYNTALRTQSTGAGDAGNINITTGKLAISDRADLAVNGLNLGKAGNLNIFANSVVMSDRGTITAATNFSNGGNIQLQIDDTLLMQENSLISAQAMGNANGGNINLQADFIVAIPQENNDIIANAFQGNGGKIAIASQGIFGIEEREQNLITNDIDASSQFNLDGAVKIVTPELEPNQSLLTLPETLINVEEILASSFCRLSTNSQFISTGRGGIPLAPQDNILAEATWEDWRIVESEENEHNQSNQSKLSPSSPQREIITAQGWLVNRQGKIVLTAKPLTVTPHPSAFNSSGCHPN